MLVFVALLLVVPTPAMAEDPSICAGGITFQLPSGDTGCSHGDDTPPPPLPQTYARELSLAAENAAGAVACTGDGFSGNRIQFLYVVASDHVNNRSTVIPQMKAAAAEMDELVQRSAQALGGDLTIRWVHDSSCQIEIETVVVPPGADDDFGSTMDALADLGYDQSDRHYLTWVDAERYCGIAASFVDDRGSSSNFNNGGISLYSRVDRGCWSATVSLHELTHMLGAVQRSAPHATDYGHCTDEYDIMCYPDGPGSTMTVVCPDRGLDALLDCGADDYFNPNPAPNSYLDTRWNVARSSFLGAAPSEPPPSEPSDPTEPPPNEIDFEDVPVDYPFANDIGWLASQGITRGCNPPTNDLFCPSANVSRAQMAAFLNRSVADQLPRGPAFADTAGSIFDEDIRRLAGAGITKGCAENRYCPDQSVTRGQMAAFLVRAFELPTADHDYFSDDNGTTFENDINRLAAAGITTGCGPDSYCPNDPITRSQMAKFLHRALT